MSMNWLLGACVSLGLTSPAVGLPAREPPSDAAQPPTTYARVLKFLDLDGNQRIDLRELSGGQQMAAMILTLEWVECDADHDGTLNAAEFEQAAAKTMQALLAEHSDPVAEDEQQAQEDLAGAVSLSLILQHLTSNPRYADEIAALHKALADLDDEGEVVTYITGHPTLYPRLGPLVRTWIRTYPTRPQLWRHAKPPAVEKQHRDSPPPKVEKAPPRRGPPASAKPAPKAAHAPPPHAPKR
jgi:hypothetical protein